MHTGKIANLYGGIIVITILLNSYTSEGLVIARRNSSAVELYPAKTDVKNEDPPLTPHREGNPLMIQPNLSTRRGDANPVNNVIRGSRHAFTVTKAEYLKKDWCKTQELRQVVREEGCLRTTVRNRFCYGQCNSFYIPRSHKTDAEGAAFTSCGFCSPRNSAWVPVTLKCPNSVPKFRRKRILMIKTCKCMAQNVDPKLLN